MDLADRLRSLVPENLTMAQMALRWVLDHETVTVVIPGASRPAQAAANARASELSPLPEALHEHLRAFYDREVHDHIRGPY